MMTVDEVKKIRDEFNERYERAEARFVEEHYADSTSDQRRYWYIQTVYNAKVCDLLNIILGSDR